MIAPPFPCSTIPLKRVAIPVTSINMVKPRKKSTERILFCPWLNNFGFSIDEVLNNTAVFQIYLLTAKFAIPITRDSKVRKEMIISYLFAFFASTLRSLRLKKSFETASLHLYERDVWPTFQVSDSRDSVPVIYLFLNPSPGSETNNRLL